MRFQKDKVLTISMAHFFHDIFSSILSVILPLLVQKLNITLTQASFLDIARKIPSLFNPFLGAIVQRKDVKYLVILTPSLTAISMGLLGVSSSYFVALILLFVAGISATLFHIPSPTIVKNFSGKNIGKGMSYFMVGGELARSIGPLLAIYTISLWGLSGILSLSILGIASSIFLYFKLKNISVNFVAKRIEKGGNLIIFKKLSPFFFALGGYLFFNNSSKYAITLYLPLFLNKHGFSVEQAGIALAFLQFFGILGAFFSGRFSDKIGRKNMILFSSLGSAVSMGFFVAFFDYSSIILYLILIPLGFFLFTSSPVMLASVQDIKSEKPIFVNSLYMGINFGISSIMVYLIGLFGEHFGLLDTFIVCAGLTLLSILFIQSKYFKLNYSPMA